MFPEEEGEEKRSVAFEITFSILNTMPPSQMSHQKICFSTSFVVTFKRIAKQTDKSKCTKKTETIKKTSRHIKPKIQLLPQPILRLCCFIWPTRWSKNPLSITWYQINSFFRCIDLCLMSIGYKCDRLQFDLDVLGQAIDHTMEQ